MTHEKKVSTSILIKKETSTYYVDNTGTGDTLATIAEVNALSLAPDDVVKFKRGCTWRETLAPSTSGISGHYVHFTSYGTGDKPRILGSSSELTGWTNRGSNIWKKNKTTNPNEIYFVKSDSSHRGYLQSSIANVNSDNDYYWGGDTLYIYATSDPNGYFQAVENATRQYCISTSADYLYIDSLEISYAYNHGIYLTQADNLVIDNNVIHHNGKGFDNIGRGITAYTNNSTISNNILYENSVSGITINPGYDQTSSNNIIEHNISFNQYHVQIAIIRDVTGTQDCRGNIIRYNTVYNINTEGSGATTPNNGGMGIEVFGNLRSSGEQRYVTNTHVYGNIAYKIDQTAFYFLRFNDSLYVYNNVAYSSGSQGIYFGKDAGQTNSGHYWVYNNISSQNYYEQMNLEDATYAVCNYNLYYPTVGYPFNASGGSTVNISTSFATWQGRGFDANGIVGNPLFTNTATYNFSLQSGSPAKNTGTNLVNSAPYFYTLDILGATVPTTTTTDMGSYEYKDFNSAHIMI